MAPYRFLSLTAALAVTGACWADTDTPTATPSQDATLSSGPPRHRGPIYFDADHISGLGQTHLLAEGNAEARRGDENFSADWLRYEPATDELQAKGNVVLQQGSNRMVCEELSLKVNERVGVAKPVQFFLVSKKGQSGRGAADKLVFSEPDKYEMDNARFTTCPANNDDWFLKSRDLDLDYNRSVGTARDVRLEYLGVPILYAPKLDFALDQDRKSGFLTPSYGISDKRGIELMTPWYWNIAPNQDATFTPRVMSRRGVQLTTEYRYLQPSYHGTLLVEAMPYDSVRRTGRYLTYVEHTQLFSPRLTGTVLAEDVSDDNYFTDLSSQVAQTSLQQLPRQAALRYDGDWWNVVGRVQSYQTLQDPANPVDIPYRRMPQIVLNADRYRLLGGGIHANLSSELVRFDIDDDSKVKGSRFNLYPSLDLNLEQPYGYIRPKFGWEFTQYQLDSNPAMPNVLHPTRSLPIFSIDSGAYLDRTTSWKGGAYTQTLEPRLYYVWIPYRDQSDLPVFDTAPGDPMQPQLYNENQFIGVDRINDANQVTVGVTSRFLESHSGKERLQLTLGQRFYFNNQRVTLPTPDFVARTSNVSNLLGLATGQVTESWRLTSGFQYNTRDAQLVQANFGAAYRSDHGKLINTDLRYTNPDYAQALKQVDLSWQWPIHAKWYSLGRFNYSLYDHRLIEGLIGFEYNAGCWTTRIVAQRLVTTTQASSTTLFLQLELGGLTRLGPNPLDVLKNSIPGYTKSDEIQDK